MKKIVVIALAAVCLLGCKKELHDPLLRQQLTTMVSSLDNHNQKAVDKAEKDIDAIASVNSAKMSEEQKKKFSSVKVTLSTLNADLAIRDLEMQLHPGWENEEKKKGILDKELLSEIEELVSEAKKAVSEVAATF